MVLTKLWLEEHLNDNITKIPHDISNFKFGCGTHLKSPECLTKKYGYDVNVLYPIRHPIETLMSYARRGFFKSPDHCFHVGGNVKNWEKFYTEKNILKRNDVPYIMKNLASIDYKIFEIKDHMLSWQESNLNVLFVAYPDIPRRWNEINGHLNSVAKDVTSEWKRNNCDLNSIQKDTLEKLFIKYREAIEIYEEVKLS